MISLFSFLARMKFLIRVKSSTFGPVISISLTKVNLTACPASGSVNCSKYKIIKEFSVPSKTTLGKFGLARSFFGFLPTGSTKLPKGANGGLNTKAKIEEISLPSLCFVRFLGVLFWIADPVIWLLVISARTPRISEGLLFSRPVTMAESLTLEFAS